MSRLEEQILRTREAISLLNQKAEQLQLEKISLRLNENADNPERPSIRLGTGPVDGLAPRNIVLDARSPTSNSALESRLAEIQQLSTQTHAKFPLQPTPRAESDFTFVSDWGSNLPYMKDPAFSTKSSSPDIKDRSPEQKAPEKADRAPRRPTDDSPRQVPWGVDPSSAPAPESTQQQGEPESAFRSVPEPGMTEPRFYKGATKPADVFRGNAEVQEMYKSTTERLKQSYEQELGPSSSTQLLLGVQVPLQVGLRVLPVDEADADAQGGAGMVSRVDEAEGAVFVLWDATGLECGWYFCTDHRRPSPLKLQPSANAKPLQGLICASDERVCFLRRRTLHPSAAPSATIPMFTIAQPASSSTL